MNQATLAFKEDVRVPIDVLMDARMVRILVALVVTAPMMRGDVVIITSVVDGTHGEKSRHYVHLAVDVRFTGDRVGAINGVMTLQQDKAEAWAKRLRQYLGSDYDVIVESDHIHVEWDA